MIWMQPRPERNPDDVTIWSLIVTSWRAAPLVMRRFALRVWAVALAAAVLCVAADLAGLWGRLSFTTNLISELISALSAFPLALLIINSLAAYQIEEAARPRLEAKVQAARARTITAVGAMRERIVEVERELIIATNDFVRAVRPTADGVTDLALANEAAQMLCGLMDAAEWTVFYRTLTPVQHYGLVLQNALMERSRDGILALDIEELARLSGELQSAVFQHRRTMEKGQGLFSRRPAVHLDNRIRHSELRDAALEYVKSIDRLLGLCDEIDGYLGGADLEPEVAP